jgi:hypothetical protein
MELMAHDVFISYAAEDKTIADAVCEAIEARGIKCWYAPRDVEYGRDFEESIVDAISASRLIVLILTSHSNISAHVKREIQNACLEEVNVPVLPFRVEDIPLNKALRYYIGSVHWLDAVTPPLEDHLLRLVEHVSARLPHPEPPAKEEREERQAPEDEVAAESPEAKPEESPVSATEQEAEIIDPQTLDTSSSQLPPQVPNYLAASIVSSVFCCLPMGVIALVLSIQATSKATAGDIEGAKGKAKVARMCLLSAVVLGLAAYVIFIFAAVMNSSKNVNSSDTNQTPVTNSNANTDSLAGLWIRVVYLPARKDEATRMMTRLTSKGAQVEIEQYDNPLMYETDGLILYQGDRLDDAKKAQRWLSDFETFTTRKSTISPDPKQPHLFVWLPK